MELDSFPRKEEAALTQFSIRLFSVVFRERYERNEWLERGQSKLTKRTSPLPSTAEVLKASKDSLVKDLDSSQV